MKFTHGLTVAAALSVAGASYGGGSASCDRSATGAYGRTYSSSGSATYGAGGGSYSRTVSTPYGGSYYGSGSFYRPRW